MGITLVDNDGDFVTMRLHRAQDRYKILERAHAEKIAELDAVASSLAELRIQHADDSRRRKERIARLEVFLDDLAQDVDDLAACLDIQREIK